jgi:hypothetical protein
LSKNDTTTKTLTGGDFLRSSAIDPNLHNEWQELPNYDDNQSVKLSILFSTGSCEQQMVTLRDNIGNRLPFMSTDKFAMIAIPQVGANILNGIRVSP